MSRVAQGRGQSAGWTQDPEKVRRNILDVAHEEFAQNGLSGARIDEIAARTATSKRMIYYYFGDKERLYIAVLEQAYRAMRAAEAALDLSRQPPLAAMEQLVGTTFDHHVENPAFVRLVMVENIHHGRHLKASQALYELNLPAIRILQETYQRGVADGVFRPGLDAMHLHLSISALCFYNVSNRYSIEGIFGHDMGQQDILGARRKVVIDTILRYVLK